MLHFLNRINDLRSMIRRGFGPYRWHILLLTFLSFLSGILEGVGINAVIPLFSLINKNTQTDTDTISQAIQSFFNFFHLEFTLRSLLLFIIVLFIIKAIILFFNNYISARIASSYEKTTRTILFQKTLEANWGYLSSQKLGYLDQVLTTDINYASSLFNYLSASILLTANLVVYILLVVNISPIIAALTLGIGLIIFFIFKPFFYRTRISSKEIGNVFKDLAHHVNENLLVMKTIKSLAVEEPIMKKASGYFEHVRFFNMRVAMNRNLINTILQPVGLIFIVGVFYFFYKFSAFSFASFAVIVFSINKIFSYIQLLQTQLHGVSVLGPYLGSVLAYREEIEKHKEVEVDKKPLVFSRELIFDDVSFSYPNSTVKVLSHVSFKIRKGALIGLIGPSGAGKTTVVDLLLRLLQPNQGTITVDGQDITEFSLKDWRSQLGYVSQETTLINDTVENNIRFYNPAINSEEMIEAAKMANIYDFIQQLPNGFETPVGERGATLSGGQKQRIVLARILARRPSILLLDEATSGLDNESESLIQKSIEALRKDMTVIVIAHRLSTVLLADQLVVIDKGGIIEEGKPQDLLKKKDSYFSRLYNLGATNQF